MTREIVRLEQIAEITGIPLATLRYYRHVGTGPKTWKLGRRVVAYRDDVEEWIARQAETTSTGGDAA